LKFYLVALESCWLSCLPWLKLQ